MRSTAPPLKRPNGLASVTVPAAVAPGGITTRPLTETGWATVPEKLSPELLRLELSVSPRRITMGSPAGTGVAEAVMGSAPAFVVRGVAARVVGVPDAA